MEIATLNVISPGSVGLAQAHPLTKPLAMGDGLPPDLVQLRSTLPIRAKSWFCGSNITWVGLLRLVAKILGKFTNC